MKAQERRDADKANTDGGNTKIHKTGINSNISSRRYSFLRIPVPRQPVALSQDNPPEGNQMVMIKENEEREGGGAVASLTRHFYNVPNPGALRLVHRSGLQSGPHSYMLDIVP